MVILKWIGKFEVVREWKAKDTGETVQDVRPVNSVDGIPSADLEKEDIDRYARRNNLSFAEAKAAILAHGLWADEKPASGKKVSGEPEDTGD